MTRIVTKARNIQFIDGSVIIIKKRNSRKTSLSGYYACLSCSLLLKGVDTHTHKHTDVRERNDFKKPGARPRAPD